jgi:hypothetical protein
MEINKDWQFWQQHNQPIQITTQKMYVEVVHYIHQNPVVSGFVFEAEQWVYSSANNYGKNDGIIKLAEKLTVKAQADACATGSVHKFVKTFKSSLLKTYSPHPSSLIPELL